MKIIHCADLHIDSKMEANLTKEQAKERKEEILRTYERMVAYAVKNDVRVIILAGDLFDKSNVGKRVKNRVVEQIANNPDIDFLYLRGNHDNVDILEGVEEEPDNLKRFSNEVWTKYEYGDVVIAGIELNAENNGAIYSKLILDKSKTNIVTLHGQESKYNNDKTEIVNLTQLKNHYIDYLALGHIHQYKREQLDDRGIWCYSGCLEGRGFDECGDKGFVLLEIDEGQVKDSFVPFATRQFHEIDIDITDVEGIYVTNEIIKLIREKAQDLSEKDIVKFVLVGDIDVDTDIDFIRLNQEFSNDFYFMKIYNCTKIKVDYNMYVNDKSLKGEFVRLMKDEALDEEVKSKIIEIGLKALRGEEIEL